MLKSPLPKAKNRSEQLKTFIFMTETLKRVRMKFVTSSLHCRTLETNKNSEEKNNKHWVRNKQ